MLKFNKTYGLLAAALFVTESAIAAFLHDAIIRPYIGDLLVVILIYCFIKSFARISVAKACTIVLVFAYAVEISQYFKLIVALGLKNSIAAILILGNSFSWADLLMYTLGIAITVAIEKGFNTKKKHDILQQQITEQGWHILWQKKA